MEMCWFINHPTSPRVDRGIYIVSHRGLILGKGLLAPLFLGYMTFKITSSFFLNDSDNSFAPLRVATFSFHDIFFGYVDMGE